MPAHIAPNLTQRYHRWTSWKAVQAAKDLVYQHEVDGTSVTVWGYDGPEVHICTIWDGEVPAAVLPVYSQDQNDADLSDWEDNFLPGSGQAVQPKIAGGRSVVVPIAFEEGTFLYIAGAADSESGRGEGELFRLARTTSGDSTLEWSFNDWVKVVGGTGFSMGGGSGDHVCFGMYAPATTLEAVTPGTGSVILVDTGFDVEGTTLNAVVPCPGGTHNVTDPVPVPTSVGEPGYWNWNTPPFGRGTVSPAAGDGKYNLYDIDVPLARWAAKIQLLGDRALSVDTGNVKPMIILPHWRWTAALHTAADRAVEVVWEVKCARMRSTKIW